MSSSESRDQLTESATSAPAERERSLATANAGFWDELCGTTLARSLGITDHSQESLRRFDAAYFDFYPYLLDHVRPARMRGARVVEIGLGYGTLGQRLVESGAHYTGLDLAVGPVKMLTHRLRIIRGTHGSAVRGSALALPFASNTVDHLISIGCFHHTGDLERCVVETHRVLRPGGTALVMVYNQFSYRQWLRWPGRTFGAWLSDVGFHRTPAASATTDQRRAYDVDSAGRAAPETIFASQRALRRMFDPFAHVEMFTENNDSLLPFLPRRVFLSTLGRTAGLDIYVHAQK